MHLLRAFAVARPTRVPRRRRRAVSAASSSGRRGAAAPTIAPDPDDAEAILHARRVAAGPDHRVRAGVLAENEAGLALMLADGWTESWQRPRLVRGDPLRWQPEAIWGQFNHAFG